MVEKNDWDILKFSPPPKAMLHSTIQQLQYCKGVLGAAWWWLKLQQPVLNIFSTIVDLFTL